MQVETPRLLLRPGRSEDAPDLAAAIGDRNVAGQLSNVPWPYSLADAENFIAGMKGDGLPRFLIFQRDEMREHLVGGCGVTRSEDARKIGYWVAKSAWKQGIATEAVAALLEQLRCLGHKLVYAEHKTDNMASRRVLEKQGFEVCGDGLSDLKSQPDLVLMVKHL